MDNQKYYIKIGGCLVCFAYQSSLVNEVLEKEYSLIQEKKDFTKKVILHTNIFLDEKPIDKEADNVQYFTARNRGFYIEYISAEDINLYIPYKAQNRVPERVLSPYYKNKWEMCIFDFLHNVFLGILQVQMLKNDMTLLHAGALQISGDRNVVLFGRAQSGKSTIVKALMKQGEMSVIAEDFAICENGERIYALPHCSRVYLKEYRKIKDKKITCLDYFSQFIYRVPYFLLKKKIVRLETFKDIFAGNRVTIEGQIHEVYFLERKEEQIRKVSCKQDEFVDNCLEVMYNEFVNFVGFTKSLEIISRCEGKSINLESVMQQTKVVFEKMYVNNRCEVLNVPVFETVQQLGEEIDNFLKIRG